MSRTLMYVRAITNASDQTGTCNLTSNSWNGNETYIRIPIGMTAKIYDITVEGEACKFIINHYHDIVTPGSSTVVDEYVLAAYGHLAIPSEGRPKAYFSYDGKQAIQITWSQTTAANSYMHFTLELSDE